MQNTAPGQGVPRAVNLTATLPNAGGPVVMPGGVIHSQNEHAAVAAAHTTGAPVVMPGGVIHSQNEHTAVAAAHTTVAPAGSPVVMPGGVIHSQHEHTAVAAAHTTVAPAVYMHPAHHPAPTGTMVAAPNPVLTGLGAPPSSMTISTSGQATTATLPAPIKTEVAAPHPVFTGSGPPPPSKTWPASGQATTAAPTSSHARGQHQSIVERIEGIVHRGDAPVHRGDVPTSSQHQSIVERIEGKVASISSHARGQHQSILQQPASIQVPLIQGPHQNIVERIEERVPFHDHRERALETPELARDQLASYASLKIKIIKATKLIAADTNVLRFWAKTKESSDPYVVVYVDDDEVDRTETVKLSTEPEWDFDAEMEIESANSVVQLQVLDEDKLSSDDMLGFVEFPVADLPFGRTVRGWFSLTAKEYLQDTSKKRLEKALKGMDLDSTADAGETPHSEKAGSILVELTLNVISGQASDELYGFCLPEPKAKKFPVTGFKREYEPIDAQALYNAINLIKESILDGFLFPVQAFIAYILTWREKWLSLLCTATAVAVALHPPLFLPMFLGLHGVFLLVLKSPKRREAMGADPHTVPVNDTGYWRVASMKSSASMSSFLERVVKMMHGKVTHQRKLQEFAAFAFEDGKPVTDYKGLKAQLREVSETKESFVSFPKKALKKGTLIVRDGQPGEIVECTDDAGSPRTYLVAFPPGEDSEKVSCKGDELEAILDLRWIGSKPVRALIPDGVEAIFTDLQPTIDGVGVQIAAAAKKAHAIIAWETKLTLYITAALFGACFLLGCMAWAKETLLMLMVYWFLKLLLVAIVILIHVWFADFMVKFRTKYHAEKAVKQHAKKDLSNWPFFRREG